MIRLFDIGVALFVLLVALPFLAFTALGIKLTSSGPILYPANRAGRGGVNFTMYKFRSMAHQPSDSSAITRPGDHRIFPFGQFIRATKLDEIPQFWNVLKGDMAIVGPRPEDPGIVARYYTEWMKETLNVRPGITSPGSLFGYRFGDLYIDPEDPEESYGKNQLPPKLAIERAYLDRLSFGNNLGVIFDTIKAIVEIVFGLKPSKLSQDAKKAQQWCSEADFSRALAALKS